MAQKEMPFPYEEGTPFLHGPVEFKPGFLAKM
jgi:hypothetical protein